MRHSPSAMASKVVLITGASSGIGEATARHLAMLGHKVVLGARRTDRTEAIAAEIVWDCGEALALPLDVTDLASMQTFAAGAKHHFGRIDVLVNNAGVMLSSPMTDAGIDACNRMIDVNLRGVLHGIAAVLPEMKAQKSGHIINVASTAAHQIDPAGAVYCATKNAVRSLSEGLRQESRDLRVTVVSPGYTRTGLLDGIDGAQTAAGATAAHDQPSMPASTIAEAIGYAIGQPAGIDVNELVIRPVAQG